MTFEERLAALGVDLSDLPNGYTLDAGRAKVISDIACRWFVDEDSPDGVALRNLVSIPLFQYILHLTDIIDRMETRIVNLTGERDLLKHMLCEMCDMEANGPSCAHCNVKTGGVPEGWRNDDGSEGTEGADGDREGDRCSPRVD